MPNPSTKRLADTIIRYAASTAIRGKSNLTERAALRSAFDSALRDRLERAVAAKATNFDLISKRPMGIAATEVQKKQPTKLKKLKLPDSFIAALNNKAFLNRKKNDRSIIND